MPERDPLPWMLVGHLLGDYLLQTAWMAEGKTHHPFPLLVHAGFYTASVALLALPAGGASLPALALIFLGHVLLDQRRFVHWWVRVINRSEKLDWMHIVVDQAWHLLILALAAMM